jgi:hypothetical protein
MSAAAPITFIRPITGQIIIGSSKALFFLPENRKFSLNDYKIDKTVSRLRHG